MVRADAQHSAETDDCERDSSKSVLDSSREKGEAPKAITPAPFRYLHGWRLHVATISFLLSLFLVNLEISMVGPSLVGIAHELQDFGRSNWVATAYLVTYTAFCIIWLKLSDVFGRRQTLSVALIFFVIFSAGCGAAQSMIQLIILRAFQGIGGSGSYGIAMMSVYELVPPPALPKYVGIVSAVFAVSYGSGPIIGGAIDQGATWRWIFLLNVPAGAVAFTLLILAVPASFPYGRDENLGEKFTSKFSKPKLIRLDLLGFFFLLAASVLLITALEEAGLQYAWSSGLVVSFLVLSAVLVLLFLFWERYLTQQAHQTEPVTPWRFVQRPVSMGLLFNSFFAGAPFTVIVVQLPQRFQAVNSVSPLAAGVRLLPVLFGSPFGSFTASFLKKTKIRPVVLLCAGALLQIIGISLLTTLPHGSKLPAATYGYELLCGLGFGVAVTTSLMLAPQAAEPRDRSMMLGGIYQLRALGGAVGLAIVSSVMNSFIRTNLSPKLSSDRVEAILRDVGQINSLDPSLKGMTRALFAQEYDLQLKIVVGFTVAQFLSGLLVWQARNQQPPR